MKSNIAKILVIILICVVGYTIIEGQGGSGIEKRLIETLPYEITNSSCQDGNGEWVVDSLEVKKLTIDRQTTNDNYKSADCTIEMEGDYIKKTAYVNLNCVKYDDGSWQVESWSRLSEPEVTPKYMPEESYAVGLLKETYGFQNLSKINEYVDMDAGEVVYYYSVQDAYEYLHFAGEGVSCGFSFSEAIDYDNATNTDEYVYRWEYLPENNTEIVWDVLGTWHLKHSYTGQAPFTTVDITVNSLSESYAGTAIKTGTNGYSTTCNSVKCYVSGGSPETAECIIYANFNGNMSSIIITCQGAEGYVSGANHASTRTKSLTVTKD